MPPPLRETCERAYLIECTAHPFPLPFSEGGGRLHIVFLGCREIEGGKLSYPFCLVTHATSCRPPDAGFTYSREAWSQSRTNQTQHTRLLCFLSSHPACSLVLKDQYTDKKVADFDLTCYHFSPTTTFLYRTMFDKRLDSKHTHKQIQISSLHLSIQSTLERPFLSHNYDHQPIASNPCSKLMQRQAKYGISMRWIWHITTEAKHVISLTHVSV